MRKILLTVLCFLIASVIIFISLNIPRAEKKPSDTEEETTTEEYISDITVIIDAGHGGEDGGAVAKSGVYEKDLNLSISVLLDSMLRERGYRTHMTRTEDILLYDRNVDYHGRKKQLDLLARVKVAEGFENAIFISIHMNAFPQSQYKGLQVYYSPNSADSKLLAEQIQSNARLMLDLENKRSIKPSGGNIFLLDRILHPAVLVECGFLSNPEEAEKLSEPSYQTEIAKCIFESVDRYLIKRVS